MSNSIGDIQMSNGLTDVFLNVLILSGSALARTAGEKRLVVWLAGKWMSHLQQLAGRPLYCGTINVKNCYI